MNGNFELHWLNIPQRVQYKLGVTVHRCLQNNNNNNNNTKFIKRHNSVRRLQRRWNSTGMLSPIYYYLI